MAMCCSRQIGKSTTIAALAVKRMLTEAPHFVLVTSPSEKQSRELLRARILPFFQALDWPVPYKHAGAELIELSNGSRCLALPDNERTNRGYTPQTLLIDEAARVGDDLYVAMRPSLAKSQGSLIAASTPFGKIGWFFNAFHEASHREKWHCIKVNAYEGGHDPAFLEDERLLLGESMFAQEYMAEFIDAQDAVFRHEDIMASLDNQLEPLPLEN